MISRILNAWSEVAALAGEKPVSRICLESTAPLNPIYITEPAPDGNRDYCVCIAVCNSRLIMAEDDILVADGLIRKFQVASGPGELCYVKVTLEHGVTPDKSEVPGNPHLTRFTFGREPLEKVFSGRRIGIDPGHGGKDRGFRGPVNLLEKDVALAVAMKLKGLLQNCGVTVVMTRQEDSDLSCPARLEVLRNGSSEICIQLHTAGSTDPDYQGYKIHAKEGCPLSYKLGNMLRDSLMERMGTDTGKPSPLFIQDAGAPTFPTVRVEPLCITHYVDEANFRAPLFRKRIAQALFNGVHRYFADAVPKENPAF